MKKIAYLVILTLCISILPGLTLADSELAYDLGSRAATVAMDLLKFEPGDENILALTNAGHALIKGGNHREGPFRHN